MTTVFNLDERQSAAYREGQEYLEQQRKYDFEQRKIEALRKRAIVIAEQNRAMNLGFVGSDDEVLKAKFKVLLDAMKNSVHNVSAKQAVGIALDSLKKLITLDAEYPRPLTKASLHGLLGEFIDLAHPHVVASKEMLIYEMLPLLGAMLGDSYYLPYGDDRHYPAIFTLAIGNTSDGKGQGFHACEAALIAVDSLWWKNNFHSNPASGEGLIRMLGNRLIMENSHKHRVAIFNTEMATTFTASNRKDSTLGGFLRKAYDGDKLENYKSESKKSTTADNYLLGFCGTITPRELREVMPQMDWSNGAQNRFLWSVATKDKTLSRSTHRPNYTVWAKKVQQILALNEKVIQQPISYSSDGAAAFDDWHKTLPPDDESILSLSQGRAPANCARVANLYAQLDLRRFEGWRPEIERVHVEAAIEIVNRSRQSVEWYLAQTAGASGISHSDVQKVRMLMLTKAKEGKPELTQTEVYKAFCHKTAEQRDRMCLEAGFKMVDRKWVQE